MDAPTDKEIDAAAKNLAAALISGLGDIIVVSTTDAVLVSARVNAKQVKTTEVTLVTS